MGVNLDDSSFQIIQSRYFIVGSMAVASSRASAENLLVKMVLFRGHDRKSMSMLRWPVMELEKLKEVYLRNCGSTISCGRVNMRFCKNRAREK